MKINGFEVECDLQVADAETLTGWFEVPSIPHTRYTIEINVGLLVGEALHAQKLAHFIEMGEICGTCGVSKDQFDECEIEGCPELAKFEAVAHAVATGKMCGTCSLDRMQWINCENPDCPHFEAIAEDKRLNAELEKSEDAIPNTDGTASDDDAPVAETEEVQMPDGAVETVQPADVAESAEHADAEP